MAFREWETFFLGTARRNGGMRSRREGRSGIDHDDPNMVDEYGAKKAEDITTSWRGTMAAMTDDGCMILLYNCVYLNSDEQQTVSSRCPR